MTGLDRGMVLIALSFDIYKFSARFTMKPTVTVPTTTTTTTDPNNMTSTIT